MYSVAYIKTYKQ